MYAAERTPQTSLQQPCITEATGFGNCFLPVSTLPFLPFVALLRGFGIFLLAVDELESQPSRHCHACLRWRLHVPHKRGAYQEVGDALP